MLEHECWALTNKAVMYECNDMAMVYAVNWNTIDSPHFTLNPFTKGTVFCLFLRRVDHVPVSVCGRKRALMERCNSSVNRRGC